MKRAYKLRILFVVHVIAVCSCRIVKEKYECEEEALD
jgi:hypothetical protein